MVEIFYSRGTERVEKEGEIKFTAMTTCKDMRSWIQSRINMCAKKNLFQEEFFFREIMNAYNHFHPIEKENNFKLELEIISGWKGEGDTRVYLGFDNDFRVKEYIKDKETGKVTERVIEVLKEDLNRIIHIIKKLELNKEYSCYEIAKELGYPEWKDLWRERKIYFKIYYFPIKVLEALKMIKYGGKGSITKIK